MTAAPNGGRTVSMTLGLLNVEWKGWADRRGQQVKALAAAGLDIACLLEVAAPDIPELAAEGGFTWWRCSMNADGALRRACVAILGRGELHPGAVHQLPADEFLAHEAPIEPELARRFSERHLAVDVDVPGAGTVRIGAFHSPAPLTQVNGRTLGDRKPWFCARIAQWVATWPSPFLFAIDANTPEVDALDWAQTRMRLPRTVERPVGEEMLVGAPDQVLHRGHDLWRDWLDTPGGATDRARVPPGGPLAHSWGMRRSFRFDQIWASDEVHPRAMRYAPSPSLSDHAMVTVTVDLPPARLISTRCC